MQTGNSSRCCKRVRSGERDLTLKDETFGKSPLKIVSQKTCHTTYCFCLRRKDKNRRSPGGVAPVFLHPPAMRLLLLLLICISATAPAQQDTVRMNFPPTEILAKRYAFRQGQLSTQTLDTSLLALLPAHTLSDRLEREAGLFIKAYGPGSLSTLSLRGTGAAHTAIVWNGLTLNSPMLGLTDLSFFPAFLTDEVVVEYGGNGPLTGNGAVGGAIRLQNTLRFTPQNRATVFSGTGSFGQLRGGAGYQWSNGKVVTQTKVYHEQAGNNFTYERPDGRLIRQQHADFRQSGLTQAVKFGRDDHYLEAYGWFLQNEREIPPHMLAEISRQRQDDAVLRGVVSWHRILKRAAFKLLAGMSDEQLRYTDPAAKLDAYSRSRIWQAEGEAGVSLRPWLRMSGQAAWMKAAARTEAYSGEARQEQQSMSLALQAERSRWTAHLALRQVFFDGRAVPLLPTASFSVQLDRYITLRADVSGVYRVPTLNDRFWQPGGNPALRPEEGYSGAAGLITTLQGKQAQLRLTANVFQSELRQAIVWFPGTDGLYSAGNIQTLRSRGAEARIEGSTTFRKLRIRINGGPVLTESIVTAAAGAFTEAIDKQLVYTPRILWKGMTEVSWKNWSIRYHHAYTGYRYTTIDHAHYLEPYDVAECSIGWNHRFGKQEVIFTGSVKNLYNNSYQIIAWRAMPGRWYEAGIMVRFGR